MNNSFFWSIVVILTSLCFNNGCTKDKDLFQEEIENNINEEEIVSNPTNSETDSTQTSTGNDTSISDKNFNGALKAFPDAFGAGSQVSGGRGGRIIKVTNLKDSGEGTLRNALTQSGKRIIIFEVSGVIKLESTLRVSSNDFTLAGQTAPDGGITLTGSHIQMVDVDNAIIRYVRIRPKYTSNDALEFINSKNIIVDHISISWGGDEVITFRGRAENITLQNSIIAEGKTGSIFGDSNNPSLSKNLSLHNCIFYNITHRFPNPNSNDRIDVINNLIYNWRFRLARTGGSVKLNHIANYYALGCKNSVIDNLNMADVRNGNEPRIFTTGNFVDNGVFPNPENDNWELWRQFNPGDSPTELSKKYQVSEMYSLLGEPLPIRPVKDLYNYLTKNSGCSKRLLSNGRVLSNYDDIDIRYLEFLSSRACDSYQSSSKGSSYSSSEHYQEFHNNVSNTPMSIRDLDYDLDNDGMPDEWETRQGLNPNEDDSNADLDGDGYTNIEEFLNIIDFVE